MSQQNSILNKAITPIRNFMHLEASGGIVLIIATIAALIWANSSASAMYFSFINTPVSIGVGGSTLNKTFLLLVNDGLMAIFFYLIGIEIKREIMIGELSSPQKASFSIFAAIGGMLVPAGIYIFYNAGTNYASGWGIPMATDIAFALGVLTLFGKRVPITLKIFLLALAIVDDLGAVLIIALFYTKEIAANYLGYASIFMFLLYLLNKAGLRNVAWGLFFGCVSWFCFLKSGVHATIAGVILAFLTPARTLDKKEIILDNYIHALHPWIAFLIMPIFAFFNAGVSFQGVELGQIVGDSVFLGIALGLLVGKPVGILLLTKAAVHFKAATKPDNISWMQVLGVSFLAGIGFTMSLFIGSLAFTEESAQNVAKMGIMIGSLISMILGGLILQLTLKKSAAEQ